MSGNPEKRKSKVRKSIVRKFNLGNFENMDIIVEQEHEIEWSDIEEFTKKSDNVTRLVARDFQDTVAMVAEELGMEEKKAFMQEYGGAKSNAKLSTGEDYDGL